VGEVGEWWRGWWRGRAEDGGGGASERRDGCRRGELGMRGHKARVGRLALGEVGQHATGAFEADGVPRVGSGEGVARLDGLGHQPLPLPLPAPAHRLLLVDLGLSAPHRGGAGRRRGSSDARGGAFGDLGRGAAFDWRGPVDLQRGGGNGGC
jgi:hypothetical protein